VISRSVLNMRPRLAINNICACLSIDAKMLSDVFKQPAVAAKFTHRNHLFLCEFGARAFYSKDLMGMHLILRWCYILQILKAVIVFISVFMVDLMPEGRRSNKGSNHGSMYQYSAALFVELKNHVKIPIFHLVRLHDAFRYSRHEPVPFSDAPHSPGIANLVNSFKPYDCLPGFHARTIVRFEEVNP
jgi:hypothetical protein